MGRSTRYACPCWSSRRRKRGTCPHVSEALEIRCLRVDLRSPRIGQVAAAARAGRLISSHIPPAVEQDPGAVIASVLATYKGRFEVAHDCMRIEVGAGQ